MHLHCLGFVLAKVTRRSRNLSYLPELTDCSRYSMACSWLWKLLLCWWCSHPSCCKTFACFESRSRTRLYACLALSYCFYKGKCASWTIPWNSIDVTDIFLLLMHVTNLEPNVFFIQWAWRIVDDVSKTLHITQSASYHQPSALQFTHLQALLKFLLLFIDYAKSEIDFICLLKVWLHPHDLRECFFSMIQ